MHFSCHMPIVEGLFFPWCVHVILINIKATYKYSFGKDRTQSASKCLWQECPDCQVLEATTPNFHLPESLSPSDSLSHPVSPTALTQTSVPQTLLQSPSASPNPPNNLKPSLLLPSSHLSNPCTASPPPLLWVPADARLVEQRSAGSGSSSSGCRDTCCLPPGAAWHRHVLQFNGSLHVSRSSPSRREANVWIIPPASSRPPWAEGPPYHRQPFPSCGLTRCFLPSSDTSGVRKWEPAGRAGKLCVDHKGLFGHPVLWSRSAGTANRRCHCGRLALKERRLFALWDMLSSSCTARVISVLGTGRESGCR